MTLSAAHRRNADRRGSAHRSDEPLADARPDPDGRPPGLRAIGIDLGSKRIGVAVSDLSGTIAGGLTTVQRSRSRPHDHEQLARIVRDEEAEVVVVGLPLGLDGRRGIAASAATTEAAQLASVVGVPVEMYDERFTTVAAERGMLEAGLNAQARRKIVDKVAAAVMLQGWLDHRRNTWTGRGLVKQLDPLLPEAHVDLDERPAIDWPTDPWDDADTTGAVERLRRQTRPMKWFVYLAMVLSIVVILIAGAVGWWYLGKINPDGDPGALQSFTVQEDDDLDSLSQRLENAGLVSDASVFRWYVDRNGGLEITPGFYQIRPLDHMGNVLDTLETPPGQTYTKVTFPEGFTIKKMATRLESTIGRMSAEDFVVAANDRSSRSVWQPLGVSSLEGLLFPDTYQVSNAESEAQVVERMVTLMERVGNQEDIETRSAIYGRTPYEILIIASMIEREASVAEDRAKISRVIHNRLFVGMPLEIDAAVLYGREFAGLDPNLPFSELRQIDTPYNTYMHGGLPPTPIANPGRASIRAALNPAPNPAPGDPICVDQPDPSQCFYFFYVLADEDGGHAFAATFEQHEANVRAARALGLL